MFLTAKHTHHAHPHPSTHPSTHTHPDIQMKQADLIQSQEAVANLQGVLDEFTAGKARADAAVTAELKQLRSDAELREQVRHIPTPLYCIVSLLWGATV